jgi:recombination protein RecA
MATKGKLKSMEALRDSLRKSYGERSARIGSEVVPVDVIPSGILAFDLATGIGGFPRGHATGIYGSRDIGKSVHAAMACANAQKAGGTAAWIAYETTFDAKWVRNFGVNTDELLITYPTTGEEAFDQMYRIVDAEVDICVFDSIGSVLGESETGAGAKPRQGGQAGLITWGVKNCVPLAYRTNTALILLNQNRANMNARIAGLKQQPGGEALEHMEAMIVQLKPGKNRYNVKIDGDDIEVGRDIVAHFQRNKLSEGGNRKAIYPMYFSTLGGHKIGVDVVEDVKNTAMRTGAITRAGAMYDVITDLNTGETVRVNGRAGLAELFENEAVVDTVRAAVLKALAA